MLDDILQQVLIAVRRLNEYLCFTVATRTTLDVLELLYTRGFFIGQIAEKSETLPIEAGSHQRQQNGRGADQRRYTDACAMRQRNRRSKEKPSTIALIWCRVATKK